MRLRVFRRGVRAFADVRHIRFGLRDHNAGVSDLRQTGFAQLTAGLPQIARPPRFPVPLSFGRWSRSMLRREGQSFEANLADSDPVDGQGLVVYALLQRS